MTDDKAAESWMQGRHIPTLQDEIAFLKQVIADQQKESALFDAGFKAGHLAGYAEGLEAAAIAVEAMGGTWTTDAEVVCLIRKLKGPNHDAPVRSNEHDG